jgi:hypothetical protein
MAQAGPGWGAGPSTGLWGRLGVGVVPRTGKLTEGSSRVMIMAFMGVVGASALLTWYEQVRPLRACHLVHKHLIVG